MNSFNNPKSSGMVARAEDQLPALLVDEIVQGASFLFGMSLLFADDRSGV